MPSPNIKSFSVLQRVFYGTVKQVIVELILTINEYQLMDSLKEKKVATPKVKAKKSPKKRASKKITEEVAEGVERVRPHLSLLTSLT